MSNVNIEKSSKPLNRLEIGCGDTRLKCDRSRHNTENDMGNRNKCERTKT